MAEESEEKDLGIFQEAEVELTDEGASSLDDDIVEIEIDNVADEESAADELDKEQLTKILDDEVICVECNMVVHKNQKAKETAKGVVCIDCQ